ncbi:MFS general substrate transporter [Ramicandelaber brevisporus]|nr:MFS general substrate transporter [Ramicandelaber brevisporus]KAI8873946.1 MFS general substrate transporter [Ramicandelaber brevisporus]
MSGYPGGGGGGIAGYDNQGRPIITEKQYGVGMGGGYQQQAYTPHSASSPVSAAGGIVGGTAGAGMVHSSHNASNQAANIALPESNLTKKVEANFFVRTLLKHYGNTEYIRSPEDIKADERVFGGLLPFSHHAIIPAAILTQFCCGTLYSWSAVSKWITLNLWPSDKLGNTATNVFFVSVGMFGITAAVMGPWIERSAPRRGASVGAMLFLLGNILTAVTFFAQQPWLLYLGYGVVGAAGLGISYVTTASVVQKWYPNARGLAAGFAVCGFGGGSLAFTKVRAIFINKFFGSDVGDVYLDPKFHDQIASSLGKTFLCEAAMFFMLMMLCGELFRAPPPGLNLNGVALQEDSKGRVYKALAGKNSAPNGGAVELGKSAEDSEDTVDEKPTIKITLIQALTSRDFWMLYFIFFANQFFGLVVISRIGNICQEIFYLNPRSQEHYTDATRTTERLKSYASTQAATWVAVDGAFNIAGRVVMAGLSDHIGRKSAFVVMLTSQIILVAIGLPISLKNDSLFGFLVCAWVATFFYGGGFGVIPAFLADMFGPYNVSACHGLMLTAWSIGGIVGGLIMTNVVSRYQASSLLKSADPEAYVINLYWIMAVMILGWFFLFFLRAMLRDRLFPAVPGQWLRLRIFGRMIRFIKPFQIQVLSAAQEEAEWEEFLMMCIIRLRLVKNEAEANNRAQNGANGGGSGSNHLQSTFNNNINNTSVNNSANGGTSYPPNGKGSSRQPHYLQQQQQQQSQPQYNFNINNFTPAPPSAYEGPSFASSGVTATPDYRHIQQQQPSQQLPQKRQNNYVPYSQRS